MRSGERRKIREDLILEVGNDFEEGFITGFEIQEQGIRVMCMKMVGASIVRL